MRQIRIRVLALLLALLLPAVLLLGLAGCAGREDPETTEALRLPEPNSAETDPAPSEVPEPTELPVTEPGSTEAPTTEPIQTEAPAPETDRTPETASADPEVPDTAPADPEIPDTAGPAETELPLLVPALVGEYWYEAFRDAYPELIFTVREEYSEEYEAGVVTEQSVSPDRQVDPGTEILICVSLGRRPEPLPELRGKTEEESKTLLEALGLELSLQSEAVYDAQTPEGCVIRTEPEAGTALNAGQTVVLVISKGPQPLLMPDLRGDDEGYAVNRLRGLGLTARTEEEYSDWVKEGRVIRQDPAPDTELEPDTEVLLVLSLGPKDPPPTEPTEPEPTEPKPTEPEPTEPEPTEPKPTEPEPTEPEPTEPKPTEPEPTEPKPTEPEPTEPQPVQPNGKVIYLTFDDGPSKYTQQLLDVLDKYNVKVTFFVVNTGYRDLIAKEAAAGHSIGVHSLTHDYEKIYASEEAYFKDLNAMNDIIEAQTGKRSTMIRFPGGSSNRVSSFNPGIMTRLTQAVTDAGYQYYDWNAQSGDAGLTTDTDECFRNVVDGVKNRDVSIVLMHDSKGYSVAAVERILIWGLENGYTFLPLTPSSPKAHHHINN